MRTGRLHLISILTMKGLAVMELVLAFFILLIVAASVFGWVADSREGGDWSPTTDGLRQSHRIN